MSPGLLAASVWKFLGGGAERVDGQHKSNSEQFKSISIMRLVSALTTTPRNTISVLRLILIELFSGIV